MTEFRSSNEELTMDKVQQIEDAIVAASDLHGTNRDDLHVTIRIAKDFYDFLVKYGDSPDGDQIDYMAGTIRSGMDEFYLLAYGCRSIVRGSEGGSFDPHVHSDFPALRERFMREFEHFTDPNMCVADGLATLFLLTHLELVFLARHFPSAIFADRASDSMTIAELRQDINRMLGGKTSWGRDVS
jgi:hypothetical protein